MKKLYLLISMVLMTAFAQAQGNSIEVDAVLSPQFNGEFDSNVTLPIRVRIQNKGPNMLVGSDSLFFDVRIDVSLTSDTSNRQDTSSFLVIKKRINQNLNVGDYANYTLDTAYNFPNDGEYTVCASVDRTKYFSQNTSKDPTSCSSIKVQLNENHDLAISKVYFSEGRIFLSTNQAISGQVKIFDITGKEVFSKRLSSNRRHVLKFNPSAKGFYFLRLNHEGKVTTSKFVIH